MEKACIHISRVRGRSHFEERNLHNEINLAFSYLDVDYIYVLKTQVMVSYHVLYKCIVYILYLQYLHVYQRYFVSKHSLKD